MLLIEALQYNPEDEAALSNCALAYLLLGETEESERSMYEQDIRKKSCKYICLRSSRWDFHGRRNA